MLSLNLTTRFFPNLIVNLAVNAFHTLTVSIMYSPRIAAAKCCGKIETAQAAYSQYNSSKKWFTITEKLLSV